MIESQTFNIKENEAQVNSINEKWRKKEESRYEVLIFHQTCVMVGVENSAEEKRLEELLFGKIEVGNSAKKAEDVASFEEDGDLDSNKQEDEEAGDYEDINVSS